MDVLFIKIVLYVTCVSSHLCTALFSSVGADKNETIGSKKYPFILVYLLNSHMEIVGAAGRPLVPVTSVRS